MVRQLRLRRRTSRLFLPVLEEEYCSTTTDTMRVGVLSAALVVLCLACAHAQGPPSPGARPPRTRFESMVSNVMGDMSSMASRLRSGISRTFGNSRSGNFRNGPAVRNQHPSEDPAIHTNEINPARQVDEDAPNAPGFAPQGIRRPPPRGNNFSLRRMVDQMMGGMRNMFQGFTRRRSGPAPGRRVQREPLQPQQQQPQLQQG